jgi:hypothetical protein
LHEPLFHYKGSLKELITLNKKANYDLNDSAHSQLPMHELNFLMLALEKRIENRPTAETLLRVINTLFDFSEKNSPGKVKKKINIETVSMGVEVVTKKETSLTKKLKLDLNSLKNYQESPHKQSNENSSARKFATSAKKVVENIWKSITFSPKKKV